MSNITSYAQVLRDRNLFRRVGKGFNIFDMPSHKYFKIFFYFNNGDSSNDLDVSRSTGLLAPTWSIDASKLNDTTYYMYNSAWSYLKMNNEDERADQLEKFVKLLSDISSQSPWYFSEISGLDSALERKQVYDFKWEEERKKITIKCLPDSYDDRIATLLDLYRSIIWSWQMKREVVPSNLRKFDMGIYIFNDPIVNFDFLTDIDLSSNTCDLSGKNLKDRKSSESGSEESIIKKNESTKSFYEYYGLIGSQLCPTKSISSSYKYIEFHNCEIDYNSSKSGYSTINNKEGFDPEYSIDIFFDDCYECRFNNQLETEFGDFIVWDTISLISDIYDYEEFHSIMEEERRKQPLNESDRLNWYKDKDQGHGYVFKNMPNIRYNNIKTNKQQESIEKNESESHSIKNISEHRYPIPNENRYSLSGAVGNAINQLLGEAKNIGEGLLKKATLGNLYTFSLTKLGDQLKSAAQGDIWSTIRNVDEYIKDAKQRHENQIPAVHSLFVKPKKILPTVKRIGSLASSQTIANNL